MLCKLRFRRSIICKVKGHQRCINGCINRLKGSSTLGVGIRVGHGTLSPQVLVKPYFAPIIWTNCVANWKPNKVVYFVEGNKVTKFVIKRSMCKKLTQRGVLILRKHTVGAFWGNVVHISSTLDPTWTRTMQHYVATGPTSKSWDLGKRP